MGVNLVHVVVVLGVAACASDDSLGPSNGTMSAKVDGAGWRASATLGMRSSAADSSTDVLVLGQRNAENRIFISVYDVTGAGTYPVGSHTSGHSAFSIIETGGIWDAPTDSTGALIMTSFTAGGMAGTFSFVATQGSFTKRVTEGAFTITF